MTIVFHVGRSHEMKTSLLGHAIEQAPRVARLRDAVGAVIESIHGLPAIMGCEMSQVRVYVGRSGASGPLLRNRWSAARERLNAPSTHAFVAFRAPLELVRSGHWERAAQRFVSSLERHRALCCANARIHDAGRWPTTADAVVYVVARVQRGPVRVLLDESVQGAVVELVQMNDDLIDAETVTSASRLILSRRSRELHYPDAVREEPIEAPVVERSCRRCHRTPRPGNYGFCGYHRRTR